MDKFKRLRKQTLKSQVKKRTKFPWTPEHLLRFKTFRFNIIFIFWLIAKTIFIANCIKHQPEIIDSILGMSTIISSTKENKQHQHRSMQKTVLENIANLF